MSFASAEASGTTQDPSLVVTYEDPTEAPAGTYLARNDDGSYLRYVLSGNSWTVTDKNGATYLFRTSTAGRQNDTNNATTTWKWMLQQND